MTTTQMTREVLRRKKADGERTGSVPYGCDLEDDGKTLATNGREAYFIGLMKVWRSEGMTYRAIASELNTRGVPTKKGKGQWMHQAVAQILKRPP